MEYLEMLDEYYDFLMELISFNLPEHRKYDILLHELNSIEFYWVIEMDENRDIDAVELRKQFLFDHGYDITRDLWDSPRSVLEVLVAFSQRIEIEITGEPGNDDLGKWFWVMLDNLGLLDQEDLYFDQRLVHRNIENWLSKKTGKSTIFPSKKLASQQNQVEMWYQMQNYLNENWSF